MGSGHPKRWHDIGRDDASKRATELLAKRGVIEIRQPQNQYKLTSHQSDRPASTIPDPWVRTPLKR